MRKTVYEWLETHHNGTAPAKKKTGRRKSLKHRATSNSLGGKAAKKTLERKGRVSQRPK